MQTAGFYRDLASRLRALLRETPRRELAEALSEIAREMEKAEADFERGFGGPVHREG